MVRVRVYPGIIFSCRLLIGRLGITKLVDICTWSIYILLIVYYTYKITKKNLGSEKVAFDNFSPSKAAYGRTRALNGFCAHLDYLAGTALQRLLLARKSRDSTSDTANSTNLTHERFGFEKRFEKTAQPPQVFWGDCPIRRSCRWGAL